MKHPEQAKRRTTLLIAMTLSIIAHSQAFDCENFAGYTFSYVAPKSIAAGVDYFTGIGLTTGIAVAYTPPRHYEIKQGANTFDSAGNSLDIFAYVGYRVMQIDYTVSAFVIAGYTMGNEYKAQPFVSTRILFPINQKAISIEPGYIFGRGVTGRLSIHLKF